MSSDQKTIGDFAPGEVSEVNCTVEQKIALFMSLLSDLRKTGLRNLPLSTLGMLKSVSNEMSALNIDDSIPGPSVDRKQLPMIERNYEILNSKIRDGSVSRRRSRPRESSDDSSHVSSDNSASSASDIDTDRLRKLANSSTADTKPELGDLAAILGKLDNRTVPALEKFDLDSGQDLLKYFQKFESYCESNFRGSDSFWIPQLEKQFQGDILLFMMASKGVDDSYSEIKKKLLKWYDNTKSLRKETRRQNFKESQLHPGEQLYMFSVRMEKMFKLAYPKEDHQKSKKLIERFTTSLPKHLAKPFAAMILDCKVKYQKPKWADIQRLATLKDIEYMKSKKSVASNNNNDDTEITINIGQGSTNFSSERSQVGGVPFHRKPRGNNDRQHNSQNKQLASSQRDNRSWSRDPCSYCNFRTHDYENCRLRLGLCFHCGKKGHQKVECPDLREVLGLAQSGTRQQSDQMRPLREEDISGPLNSGN